MRVDIKEVPNVCNYCRKLVKQPEYPEYLEIYRGDMLCLTVNVKWASQHRLVEDDKKGLHYKKYKQEEYDMLKLYPTKGTLDTCDSFK